MFPSMTFKLAGKWFHVVFFSRCGVGCKKLEKNNAIEAIPPSVKEDLILPAL